MARLVGARAAGHVRHHRGQVRVDRARRAARRRAGKGDAQPASLRRDSAVVGADSGVPVATDVAGTGPPASGHRLSWEALPDHVRAAVEDHLGAGVVRADTQTGGFSPGAAARLTASDGRRAFVKAISSDPNPESPEFHRREARIASQLPADAPVPRLLWTFDDGEWVVLLFEDIDGTHPAIPWRDDELARVLTALHELGVALTPSPIDAPPIASALAQLLTGWRSFVASGSTPDGWAGRHLHDLASLEAPWSDGVAGTTLLHTDLRADNVLLTTDRVVFIDWPWAAIGAPWLDLANMLPSIAMQGGPEPWTIFDAHPSSADADPAAVTAYVAGLAGFFVWGASQPAPPGLPTLREFQRAQGEHAVRWLQQRTGWG
ncbi:MAG: aminoglycoside phosphotransferase family protein [Actinobacteria bacterium]|nr:aminoglycoside phosphotransferase family protein [Actinomycetota bacterium]